MKIFSWNVNGIRACSEKGLIPWLEKESPDIFCVQETKAFPEQLPDFILKPGPYQSYWNNPPRKGYAGVAVYTRKKPAKVEKDFNIRGFDTEGRALILDYGKFILMNIYFPNGGMGRERLDYKLEFYDKFLRYADKLKNRNIIITGDFNTAHKEIDLARPRENEMFTGFLPVERKWIDKFVSRGYVDAFRYFNKEPGQYTWWDYKTRARERNVGWRIDYFFVTEKLTGKLEDAYILPQVKGSDHCPIGLKIKI